MALKLTIREGMLNMYITKEEIKTMQLSTVEQTATNYRESLKALQAPQTNAEHDSMEIVLKTIRTYETALLETLYSHYGISNETWNDRVYSLLKEFTRLAEQLLNLII